MVLRCFKHICDSPSTKMWQKSGLTWHFSFVIQLHHSPRCAQARLGRQGALFGSAGCLVDSPAPQGAGCMGPQGFRALHSIDGNLPAAAADGGGRFPGGRGGASNMGDMRSLLTAFFWTF